MEKLWIGWKKLVMLNTPDKRLTKMSRRYVICHMISTYDGIFENITNTLSDFRFFKRLGKPVLLENSNTTSVALIAVDGQSRGAWDGIHRPRMSAVISQVTFDCGI